MNFITTSIGRINNERCSLCAYPFEIGDSVYAHPIQSPEDPAHLIHRIHQTCLHQQIQMGQPFCPLCPNRITSINGEPLTNVPTTPISSILDEPVELSESIYLTTTRVGIPPGVNAHWVIMRPSSGLIIGLERPPAPLVPPDAVPAHILPGGISFEFNYILGEDNRVQIELPSRVYFICPPGFSPSIQVVGGSRIPIDNLYWLIPYLADLSRS